MQQAETWRLFVALALPEPVKDEVEKAQAELRRALTADCVRWTKRAQFHLTLKFLGDVEVDRANDVKARLGQACEAFSAMRLKAEGVGFFPSARSPRVIWAGVHDSRGTLAQLQAAVNAALRPFTAEEPEGRFTGHVTVGRVKLIKRPQAEQLSKVARGMVDRPFGEWTADHLELIRSELAPDGARHTTLTSISLMPRG